MSDSHSGMTAIVAVIAIVAILIVGYFAVQLLVDQQGAGNGINVNLDTTPDGQ